MVDFGVVPNANKLVSAFWRWEFRVLAWNTLGICTLREICKDYVRNMYFGVGDLQGMCTEYVGNMYGRYWKGLWVTYWEGGGRAPPPRK